VQRHQRLQQQLRHRLRLPIQHRQLIYLRLRLLRQRLFDA
jgi:hypothetical protein